MKGGSFWRALARFLFGYLVHSRNPADRRPRRPRKIRSVIFLATLLPVTVFATDEPVQDEALLDLIWEILPQTWEGWIGTVLVVCAILAAFLPSPGKKAHPIWKTCHRIICCLGLGAGRLRSSGKIGKVVKLFRKKP